MPKYLCTYTVACMTRRELEQLVEKLCQPGEVRCLKALVNNTEGRMICLFEAPSLDALKVYHVKMRLPQDEIMKVDLESDDGNLKSV